MRSDSASTPTAQCYKEQRFSESIRESPPKSELTSAKDLLDISLGRGGIATENSL
jgi:hypothetical protein